MDFFGTVPRPHFLGRALVWPSYFGEHVLGLFGEYPSSLSKFEFRGKSCVKREHGGENGISCLLPCILLLYIQ